MEAAFDGQGNPYLLTNYDAATSGSIVNQVQRGYNGLGQMTTEWQAVNGAVNTSTSPKVQYAFSEMASAANHSRPTSTTYPNGRVLNYNYASGLDSNISRLSSITDGATTLEGYSYLGLGTVVIRSHSQPGIDLTYVKQTGESDGSAGDKYIGLDAFGRVADQRWRASSSDVERFSYGFDRDSNRLYRENLVSSTRSELYAYDNLNQLTNFSRGTLNGTKTALTGSASRSQSWDFDALGNFDSQTTDGTAQTRTHNKQNEMTAISGATTPTYDANGNQTKDEAGRTFEYDGWNRLIRVKNSGGTTLAIYEPDALGRRIQETRSGTTTDQYYSNQWQVIEERVSGSATLSYAWSPVYVDAMIARDRDTDANGSLDERLYPLEDANFNVSALVNTSGTVVERYLNDPYGTVGIYDASWGTRSSSSHAWNYNHQGGRLDNDSGIYGFRNRDLKPTLGRWIQLDPIGFNGGTVDLYQAYGDSPTVFLDPSGTIFFIPIIVGVAVGGFILFGPGAGTAQAPAPGDTGTFPPRKLEDDIGAGVVGAVFVTGAWAISEILVAAGASAVKAGADKLAKCRADLAKKRIAKCTALRAQIDAGKLLLDIQNKEMRRLLNLLGRADGVGEAQIGHIINQFITDLQAEQKAHKKLLSDLTARFAKECGPFVP